jgi:hypothetical protein
MKPSGYNIIMRLLFTGMQPMRQTIAALLLLAVPVTGTADEAQHTEYRIKAAFLYNFSRFVVWPEAALQDRSEFSLCTLGSTRFDEQLDTLVGKTVHNKALVVKRFERAEQVLDCQLVFIGEHDSLPETLRALREQPVLTVSNAAAFTEQGGIIQFTLVDNKVRFRINADAARTAGLTISSKLLSLAISVTGTR